MTTFADLDRLFATVKQQQGRLDVSFFRTTICRSPMSSRRRSLGKR